MSIIHTLAKIGLKPTTTTRDSLTIARRICRHMCEARNEVRTERRELRRQAAKLRQFEPFTKLAADTMEQQAREHRAAEMDSARRVLVGYGRMILLDHEGYAEALGFNAMCDLLNINRADRERARREGWRTLSDLVAIHDLENSAERRSGNWGAGSPLYEASFSATVEFIRTAPDGTLPDPFAPGEIFGPKLPPVLRVVRAD